MLGKIPEEGVANRAALGMRAKTNRSDKLAVRSSGSWSVDSGVVNCEQTEILWAPNLDGGWTLVEKSSPIRSDQSWRDCRLVRLMHVGQQCTKSSL
jgi:hypothetical protein